MQSPLPPILTLARTGATSRAWDAFVAAGLDGASDINALTLKGRLLKDRARQAKGRARAALFAQSGAAYAAAARLRPDSYPLINAAAMALFAGDGASAATLARDTLTLIDGDPAQGETPYWREATRAEALLLLGRTAEAQASLTTAINAAPQAYEDHAATLRQFAAILGQTGSDAAWLDHHRPPPSLHYRGILGISADDTAAASSIHGAVAEIAPGFAYGALAAGADIIVAEAVLQAGGELHVVLPTDVAAFRQSSVLPYGADWDARFDALLEKSHSLTICSDSAATSHASVQMAEYQAMGMAAQRASLLESCAVGLRIEPEARAKASDPWLESGRRIKRLSVHENAGVPPANLPDGNLLFLLALAEDAQIADALGFSTLGQAIAAIPPGASTAALDCTIGQSRDTVAALLRNAAPGSIVATGIAAMAIMAEGRCSGIEPLGEIDTGNGAVAVYAVRMTGSG